MWYLLIKNDELKQDVPLSKQEFMLMEAPDDDTDWSDTIKWYYGGEVETHMLEWRLVCESHAQIHIPGLMRRCITLTDCIRS